MTRYVLGRVVQGLIVIWAAFTLSFFILYIVVPGDPIELFLAQGGASEFVDPAQAAELRAKFGLDQPLLVQYLTQLTGVLRFDFGLSFRSGRPVSDILGEALPNTLILAGAALVVAVVAAGVIAILGTFTRRKWLSRVLLALPPLGVAIPSFWIGLVAIQIFSFQLGLLPAFGNSGFNSLILPACALAVTPTAVLAQILARSIRQTEHQPFIDTARAKGASPARIHFKHILRNASIPAMTIGGLIAGQMVSGAVVIETVFARSGVGRIGADAVIIKDIPIVQAVVVLGTIGFVGMSLIIDLLYPLLDPRIRAVGRKVAV